MKEKRTAVLISCFGWYEQRLELIRDVLKEEYNVLVLMADFDHIKKSAVETQIPECIYLHVPPYKKNISLKRIKSHLCFGSLVKRYIEETSPSLLYLIVPPNHIARHCLQYKQAHKDCKYLIDIVDLWPESMPFGNIKKFLRFSGWKDMRNDSLKVADHIFVECDLYRKKLDKVMDKRRSTVLHLYKRLSSDEHKLVVSLLEETKRTCLKNKRKLALGYVGSINHIVDHHKICGFIEGLVCAGWEVALHVIGDGEERENFLAGARRAGGQCIYYGKVFDFAEKANILCRCDYGLNIMKDSVEVGLTTKSLEYFSMGIPLINNIRGDTWDIVEEYGAGINYRDLSYVLSEIQNEGDELRDNALKCYSELFTPDVFRKKFCEAMEQVESGGKRLV